MTTERKRKNRKILIILGILALAMVAWVVAKGSGKPKGEAIEMSKVEKRTIIESVTASGKIYPETEVKISSDVSGEIVELYVEEGDSVVANQVLAKIDPDTYVSAVERGNAAVNSAKSQRATAMAQVETSTAQAEQIKAQLANAKTIHDRNVELNKSGVISSVELEQSLSNLRSLQANLKAAEAGIRAANQNVEGARFQVESAQASLKELRTSLSRTTIKSPTSGTISSLSVEKGERVVGTMQMTGTEMMRISNLNNMEVQVEVSENDIPRVSLGDKASVEVDAYADKTFVGTVTQIANSASNIKTASAISTDKVTNFIVKIRIDQSSYKDLITKGNKFPFRPGMSASVDIFTEEVKGALTLPILAVTMREKESEKNESGSNAKKLTDDDYEEVIFVVEADTVRRVKVSTGIQDDEYIQVLAGVDEDAVVASGPYNTIAKKLEGGDAVREKKDKDEEKPFE